MKVVYEKMLPSVVKENRKFYKDHVKVAFVKWCAYKGYFDGVFTEQEIDLAQRKGHLPKDCDIHHILPLSGCNYTNANDFTNLVVLHKSTHRHINKTIFQPQLKDIEKAPYGTLKVIDIPSYRSVDRDGIVAERNKLKNMLTNSKRRV